MNHLHSFLLFFQSLLQNLPLRKALLSLSTPPSTHPYLALNYTSHKLELFLLNPLAVF